MAPRLTVLWALLACAGCGGSSDAGSDADVCLAPTGPTVSVSCPMGGAAEMPMGGVIPAGTYDLDQYLLFSSSCGSPRTVGGTLLVAGNQAHLDISVSTLASPTIFACQSALYTVSGMMLDPSHGYTSDAQGVTIYEAAGASWQRTSHWKHR